MMFNDFKRVPILMLPLKIRAHGCENDTLRSKTLLQVLLITLSYFGVGWAN